MKVSITGLGLSGFYLSLSIVLLVYGSFIVDDPKGSFVFKQLPIAIPIGMISAIGLASFLEKLSWFWAYFLLLPPVSLCMYGIGWLFGWLGTALMRAL